MVKIKIKKLHADAIVPSYAHDGDAGMDLYSVENHLIQPGERVMVATGIAIELPKGHVSLIWDKSGVAAKGGIKTMGGVCDANYRGEYKVIMFNTSKQAYEIKKGEKIAQILIQPVIQAEIEEAEELSDTSRANGGFGSTGLKKN